LIDFIMLLPAEPCYRLTGLASVQEYRDFNSVYNDSTRF